LIPCFHISPSFSPDEFLKCRCPVQLVLECRLLGFR
jgi:hypothetical protein